MPSSEELLKQADIEDIAKRGTAIYESVKGTYGPEHKGKFLAIDVESKDVYLADTSSEAVESAKKAHPNNVFYVVRVGFSFTEALANMDEYAHWLHSGR